MFDGVCNLCARSVQWIMRHEADQTIRFANLQSPAAAALLKPFGIEPPVGDPDSILVIADGRLHTHSSGVLSIGPHLRQPYRTMLATMRIVPRPLRDAAYRYVARHRYTWMGKQEACWVPTPERRARFL